MITETANGHLVTHVSDAGVYIRQVETGYEYAEAVDIMPCKYTYEETDKAIEVEEVTAGADTGMEAIT